MKYFKLKLIFLFSFLLAALIAFAFIFGRVDYFFTQFVLGGVIIFLVWQSFYLIDTTNREVNKFLFALNYLDSSLSFPENTKNSFHKLYQGLNQATEKIALKTKQEKQHSQWMEEVIRRIPFGIFVIQEQGKVLFQNDFLLEFLAIPKLQTIDQLTGYHKELSLVIQEVPLEKRQSVLLKDGKEVELFKVGYKQEETFEIVFLQPLDELKGSIEMNAWMKLIRVLTHEIMNSITSISSLASTLHESIQAEGLSSDLQLAAESIEKRSQSLIRFTESYRKVSDLKAAQKSWFLISELIRQQVQFLSKDLEGISIEVKTENEQQILADREQTEQVFINLLLNAKAALRQTEKPTIEIKVWQEETISKVSFTDNGAGIPAKEQNQIFIPFYTTRPDGKGIGLSLCRQLMNLNNGTVSLQESGLGKTSFLLRFKN